jgi:hypothetical protein
MKNKQIIPAFLFLLFCASTLVAQDLVIEDVSTNMRKYRGVEHLQGKGHTLLMVDEKSSKGMKLFKFYLWDYQLNEIANKKIELEKRSWLIDNAANKDFNLLVFYDSKKDNVRSLSIDNTGKIVGDKLIDGIKTKFMAVEDLIPSYYPSGNDGFIGIVPDKEPKFGFHMSRYDNQLNTIWSSDYFPTKGMQIVMDAVSDKDKVVLLKYGVNSKMSKKLDVDITAFDNKTGKELWSFDLNLGDKTLYPTEITITSNGNVAVAGMYFDGDKVKGANSDGIFFVHVGKDGSKLATVSQEWDGELQKFLKDSKNSVTVGKPKVVFEDIVYDEKAGEFKVIGEIYTIGTLGKALAMLGGSDPDDLTKVTIEDLVVFSFKENGALVDFYSVNKARTNIYVPTTLAGGPAIANILKQTGMLPYAFSSKNAEGEVIAFYKDFVKQDEDGSLTNQKIAMGVRKIGIGMLNVSTSSASAANLRYLPFSKRAANKDDGSDVEFDSKRSILMVAASDPGFVIVSELSRKTGQLRIFKESIAK